MVNNLSNATRAAVVEAAVEAEAAAVDMIKVAQVLYRASRRYCAILEGVEEAKGKAPIQFPTQRPAPTA